MVVKCSHRTVCTLQASAYSAPTVTQLCDVRSISFSYVVQYAQSGFGCSRFVVPCSDPVRIPDLANAIVQLLTTALSPVAPSLTLTCLPQAPTRQPCLPRPAQQRSRFGTRGSRRGSSGQEQNIQIRDPCLHGHASPQSLQHGEKAIFRLHEDSFFSRHNKKRTMMIVCTIGLDCITAWRTLLRLHSRCTQYCSHNSPPKTSPSCRPPPRLRRTLSCGAYLFILLRSHVR